MLVFTIVTLTPYYLLTISLPRKKVAKTMSVRFYFNVVTISLFIYLLKSPIDGLLGLLSNLDLSLNLSESVIYNKTIFNAESLCIVLKSALYSFLWISYSVWMATLSKLNLYFPRAILLSRWGICSFIGSLNSEFSILIKCL